MALSPTSSRASSGSTGAVALISTTTLGADGTFDVSAIAGTYNDLRLVVIARGTRAATTDPLQMRFNNDSAASYEYGFIKDVNATVSGSDATGATSLNILNGMAAASATANLFSCTVIDIPGYASTVWSKFTLAHALTQISVGGVTNAQTVQAGWWNSTAAITRVQIFAQVTANLLAGSTLRIYGIT